MAAIKKDPALVKRTPVLDGRTLLHLAARSGYLDLVALLIEHGADLHAAGDDFTPLHYAARHGHAAVIDLLVAKGAKVDARTPNGYSPLSEAIKRDQPAAVKALLKNKADVNLRPDTLETLLHEAISAECSEEVIQLLLSAGADPNARDKSGRTPCDSAKHNKNSKKYLELLKKFGGKE